MSLLIKPNPATATVVFAPIDALYRRKADIALPGVNDQDIINNWCQVGRRLVFLDGTVHLSAPIIPPLVGNGFALEGQGREVTIFFLEAGSDSSLIRLEPTADCSHFTFKGFSLDGNGVNQADGLVRNQLNCLHIGDDTETFWCNDFLFQDIFVHNGRHGTGFRLWTGLRPTYHHCLSMDNGVVGAAWPMDGFYTHLVRRGFFSDCHSMGNSDTGFANADDDWMHFDNLHAWGNTYHGITMAWASTYFMISNSFFQSSWYGFKSGAFLGAGRTGQVLFSCCSFLNNSVVGLEIEDHDDLLMVGCNFGGNVADYAEVNPGGLRKGRGCDPMVDFG